MNKAERAQILGTDVPAYQALLQDLIQSSSHRTDIYVRAVSRVPGRHEDFMKVSAKIADLDLPDSTKFPQDPQSTLDLSGFCRYLLTGTLPQEQIANRQWTLPVERYSEYLPKGGRMLPDLNELLAEMSVGLNFLMVRELIARNLNIRSKLLPVLDSFELRRLRELIRVAIFDENLCADFTKKYLNLENKIAQKSAIISSLFFSGIFVLGSTFPLLADGAYQYYDFLFTTFGSVLFELVAYRVFLTKFKNPQNVYQRVRKLIAVDLAAYPFFDMALFLTDLMAIYEGIYQDSVRKDPGSMDINSPKCLGDKRFLAILWEMANIASSECHRLAREIKERVVAASGLEVDGSEEVK